MLHVGHADARNLHDSERRLVKITGPFRFRMPAANDAPAVSRLIAACPPLDTNSLYCTLLQCTHFAGSCVLAERDGRIAGWLSGYRPASDPDAAFVWQVAVHEGARGLGLAGRLLDAWRRLPAVADAKRILATITPSNRASHGLFASFAARHGWPLAAQPGFDAERHLGGAPESEELIIIGPETTPRPHQAERIIDDQ